MQALGSILLLLTICAPLQDPEVENLIKRLGDDSIEVREKAAAALRALGEKVEERLKVRLQSAQGALRNQIEAVLQSIRRARNLDAVLPPVKRITLDCTEKPWDELAKEFQRQSGWPVILKDAPKIPVTLRIADATPFEALDALCRAGNFGFSIESSEELRTDPRDRKMAKGLIPGVYDYSDPAGIRFSREYHNGPKICVRQYSVSLQGVALNKMNDFKAHSSMGLLSVHLRWPPVAKPESIKEFGVISIQDDGNRELCVPAQALADPMPASKVPWPEGEHRMIYFNHPPADAKKIARIKGKATFAYPVDDVLVTFSPPKESVGQRETFDGVQIVLKEYHQERDVVRAEFEVSGKRETALAGRRSAFAWGEDRLGINKDFVRMRTKDGETTEQVDRDLMQKPDCWVVRLRYVGVKSEVLAIDFIMETIYQTDSFEFEFKDIELPR